MKKSIFLFFAAILCAMTANAVDYYYRGQRVNNWGAGQKLEISTDTYYSYIYFAAGSEHEFKICEAADDWSKTAYGKTYNSVGFNGTDVTELGDHWGGENCKIWSSKAHYVLVYHPNTEINNTNKPIICASTFLPNDAPVGSDPVITVTPSALDFGYVELSQTKTLTTTYTLENISDEANISVSGEGFTAVDNEGTISVTFAPTTEGDYTGTLTVTAGETSKEVSLSAKGVVTHEITVKAKYPDGWNAGKAAVHFWGDGVTGATPAAMTKDGDWWSYTVTGVPTTSELSVIFINGDNWNGDANQTVDITGITESTCFQVTAGAGKASAEKVDCEGTPSTPEPTELTYNVTVPAGTNACYICGNMTGWNFTEMTKVDDTHYTITIEGAKKSDGYKYASGGEWGYVEKDANGNEIGDRTYGDGNDVVARWASVYDPDAVEQELTYSVTVPEGTYACYIAMDTDPAQDGWEFNEMTKVDDTHYTFTRTGLKNKTYKYTCGEGWEYVEKTAEDGDVADRTWAENDVVAKWASVYNPTAPTYDYYIAGTENLTGYNWKENGLGMIQDGDYKAIFSELPAGTYEFKITDGQWNTNEDKTHEWGYSNLGAAYEEVSEGTDGEGNPNGNIKFVTEEAKNITVIFDPATGKITIEGLTKVETETLVYTVEVPEGTEDCYIAGEMNEWAFERMTQVDATHWTITYDNVLKTTEYKYACQADWDYAEKDAEGNDVANRTWTANDVVAKWGVPPTYTIVGATAIGVNWDPANEDNKMTKDGEVYTLTKTGLQLEAGDYEYKVAKNGAWGDGEYPAEGNQKVTIEENGVYTIVYTYTVGTLLNAEPTKTGDYTPEKPVYTVAGDAALCGTNWDAGDTDNDMSDNGDGTFTWTKTDVTLTDNAGFKVVKNHDFGTAYPADNWVINIANYEGAAIYTVTITFTESSKDIAVTLTKTGDAAPAVISYVLMGVNGDWTNGIALTQDPGNADQYVLENQVIIKATDAIKVVTLTDGEATAWCGNVDSWSNATYTGGGEDNIVLEDGIYTFYFKKTANNIYINQTGYARNVTNTYGTICLPYAAASTTGAIFYRVAGKETGKVYLESVDALEAGVPYIFEKTANQIKVVYTGDKETTPGSVNGLVGTFTNETEVAAGNYILLDDELRPSDGNAKVNANRAYLVMEDINDGAPLQMPGRRYIGMSVQGENETTGLDNITNGENTTIKLIENGQLIIIRNGEKFNAQGQKL